MPVAIVASFLLGDNMTVLKPVEEALALGTKQMCIDAINGVKKISVRPGNRRYTEGGVLVLYNEEYGFVAKADVTSVRYTTLGKLTEEELRSDGFKTHDALLKELNEKFYNGMLSLESDMTVLRWDNIRGPVVNDYRAEVAARSVGQ